MTEFEVANVGYNVYFRVLLQKGRKVMNHLIGFARAGDAGIQDESTQDARRVILGKS